MFGIPQQLTILIGTGRRMGASKAGRASFWHATGEISPKGGEHGDHDAQPAQGGTEAHGAVSRGAGAPHGRTAHHATRRGAASARPTRRLRSAPVPARGAGLRRRAARLRGQTETRKGGEAGERRSDVTETPETRNPTPLAKAVGIAQTRLR